MPESKNQFLIEHEVRINRIITYIYLFLCLFPILILIMSIPGYYNLPLSKAVTGVAGSVFLGGIILFFYFKKLYSKYFKLIVILSIQFLIFLYSTDVNIQITILYMLGPLFAMLYFNPGFTFISCVFAFVSMCAGTVLSSEQATIIIWKDVSPFQYVLTTGSARALEIVFASAILINASLAAKKIMLKLEKRNQDINDMQSSLIFSFAELIESRDGATGEHVKRTSKVVSLITDYILNNREQFSYPHLDENTLNLISLAAPLHDIGKMMIPDSILSKPGKLTSAEFEIIKTHSEAGAHIIDKTMHSLENEAFICIAREMALSHHEKWDGTGYPYKLKGNAIPLPARIMAVADVFDALCSKRSYKDAYTVDEAFKIMIESKGKHFEPQLVDLMIKIRPLLENIYSDNSEK